MRLFIVLSFSFGILCGQPSPDELDELLLQMEFSNMHPEKSFSSDFHRDPARQLKSGMGDIGNAPDWNWIRVSGGSPGADIYDIEIDASENVFVAGTFSDSMIIASNTLVSIGFRDVFIAKFSKFGILQWIRQFSANPEENLYAQDIELVPGGKVCLLGQAETGTITAGGLSVDLTEEWQRDFYALLDASGTPEWIRLDIPWAEKFMAGTDGSIYTQNGGEIRKNDPDGNHVWDKWQPDWHLYDFLFMDTTIMLLGAVADTGIAVGSHVHHDIDGSGALFLAELGQDGQFGMVRFMNVPNSVFYLKEDRLNRYFNYFDLHLAIDNQENLYMAGNHQDEFLLGDTVIFYYPNRSFLLQFDDTLGLKWKIDQSISGDMEMTSLMSSGGNVFVYGMTYGDSISMGGFKQYNEANVNMYFLSKIDEYGIVHDVKTYDEQLHQLKMAGNEKMYYYSYQNYDMSLYKQDYTGARSWEIGIWNNGRYSSFWYTMDIDELGNLYAQGFYSGRVNLLGRYQEGGRGIFFVKFRNDGKVEWLRTMDCPNGVSSGIKVDKDMNVYAWGEFGESISIEGQEYHTSGGDAIYLIKFDLDGELKFLKQFEASADVVPVGGIDVDPEGNVVITGWFSDTLDFSNYRLIS